MRWYALFSLDSAMQGASHWFPICCFVRRCPGRAVERGKDAHFAELLQRSTETDGWTEAEDVTLARHGLTAAAVSINRTVRGTNVLDHPIEDVFGVLTSTKLQTVWDVHCLEAADRARSTSSALVFLHFNAPWPVAHRELHIQVDWKLLADSRVVVLIRDAADAGIPATGRGRVRAKVALGGWLLTPRAGTAEGAPPRTEATYMMDMDMCGSLPVAFKDAALYGMAVTPAILGKFMDSGAHLEAVRGATSTARRRRSSMQLRIADVFPSTTTQSLENLLARADAGARRRRSTKAHAGMPAGTAQERPTEKKLDGPAADRRPWWRWWCRAGPSAPPPDELPQEAAWRAGSPAGPGGAWRRRVRSRRRKSAVHYQPGHDVEEPAEEAHDGGRSRSTVFLSKKGMAERRN